MYRPVKKREKNVLTVGPVSQKEFVKGGKMFVDIKLYITGCRKKRLISSNMYGIGADSRQQI